MIRLSIIAALVSALVGTSQAQVMLMTGAGKGTPSAGGSCTSGQLDFSVSTGCNAIYYMGTVMR